MKQSRVEAFTDAIVAIIMTIMILEFKTPETPSWTGILADVPYLFAYVVSFFFMAVAWYNHHYLFALLDHITKRIYWVNNMWLLTMSMIPVGTAWTGRYIFARGPEYFYLLVFFLWSLAFVWLSVEIRNVLRQSNPKAAEKIDQMATMRFMNGWKMPAFTLGLAIATYFFPPLCLVATLGELIYMGLNTNADADRVA